MNKKVLTLSDYDFITYAVYKFVKHYNRVSKGDVFVHTYEQTFFINDLVCTIIRRYFEFGEVRDIVHEILFKLIAPEDKWPYKVPRKEFVNFIYNIYEDYEKPTGERK